MSERFQRNFARSEKHDPANIALLWRMYPRAIRIVKGTGIENKKGIDFKVFLTETHYVKIEIKNYERNEGFIYLETWSVRPFGKYGDRFGKGRHGWAMDEGKESDIIIFTWPSGEIFWCKYKALRMEFRKNARQWAERFPVKPQDNGDYESESMKVPLEFITEVMEKYK